MFPCGCSRTFGSSTALAQHQNDKHKIFVGSARQNLPPPSASMAPAKQPLARHPGDRWMWKHARTTKAQHVISEANLEPCSNSVTSDPGYQLICTYNWQDSKKASIEIPGFAPIWQHVPLPIALPPDKGTYYIDQSEARIPEYPFEPVFRAAEVMSPVINFDDIDIIINRNSLRKFLDFCAGIVQVSFCVNLSIVHNTLFVERCEKSARHLIRGAGGTGWGHNFEKAFTKISKPEDRSTQHHRVLKYAMGGLNCLVRFEVDACYEDPGERGELVGDGVQNDLALELGNLSIGSTSGNNEIGPTQTSDTRKGLRIMPQSTAAEIKTSASRKTLGSCLPQLWFGRTPWLIVGHHVKGTFDRVHIANAEHQFAAWESRHQIKLRKMVTLLSQLREAVKMSGSKRCIAICEKGTNPRELAVFESTFLRDALPSDLIRKFWSKRDVERASPSSV
ncbi:hypothetical protein F4823DRAFT_283386 [Ustulina deusta]|nr:hypothetical protein F4823DRAFT_283386 [Ustulina deusta]